MSIIDFVGILEIARFKLILHFWWGTLGKMQLMLRKAAKALYAVIRIHIYLFSHLKKTILAKTYSERKEIHRKKLNALKTTNIKK